VDLGNGGTRQTYVFAHERCATTRNTAFLTALRRARANGLIGPEVALTPITPRAIRAYQVQWRLDHWTGDGGWRWDQLMRRFTRKPRSFHAALWSGPDLCALCVGRVSKGRRSLTLHYMESAPDPKHPLRGIVTLLMFEAAVNYGLAMECDALLLREPLPGVMARYEAFGFRLDAGASRPLYFSRTLRRERPR
jgi:hypothetical protein